VRIRATHRLSPLARDLRGCDIECLPAEICCKPLIPIDTRGRVRNFKREEYLHQAFYLRPEKGATFYGPFAVLHESALTRGPAA
jgi:hypothetical protein